MLFKKLKYITISVFKSIKYDYQSTWKQMDRPKVVMDMLFWVMIIQFFTERYSFIPITLVLYLLTYCWKVVRRGEWKHLMRESYSSGGKR